MSPNSIWHQIVAANDINSITLRFHISCTGVKKNMFEPRLESYRQHVYVGASLLYSERYSQGQLLIQWSHDAKLLKVRFGLSGTFPFDI